MSLLADIQAYAAMVELLPHFDDEGKAENVLLWRDRIHARLSVGAELGAAEVALLDQADQALIEQRTMLLDRWPGMFAGNNLPRVRWWWHLDTIAEAR